MGVHPKIGITGLPRSGKSAVMEKVLDMLIDERKREISMRGGSEETTILGGVRTEPLLENGERMGYKIIDIVTEKRASSPTKTLIPDSVCSVTASTRKNWTVWLCLPSTMHSTTVRCWLSTK